MYEDFLSTKRTHLPIIDDNIKELSIKCIEHEKNNKQLIKSYDYLRQEVKEYLLGKKMYTCVVEKGRAPGLIKIKKSHRIKFRHQDFQKEYPDIYEKCSKLLVTHTMFKMYNDKPYSTQKLVKLKIEDKIEFLLYLQKIINNHKLDDKQNQITKDIIKSYLIEQNYDLISTSVGDLYLRKMVKKQFYRSLLKKNYIDLYNEYSDQKAMIHIMRVLPMQ